MNNPNSILKINNEIQADYLFLLKSIRKYITKENMGFALDEIQVFWKKHEKKINFILEWMTSKEYSISYFTCATIFDTNGRDYYPFLLYGDYHIFDDPLVFHLNTTLSTEGEFSIFMYSKIIDTIEDNIRIITEYSENIWVIPIRFLFSTLSEISDVELKSDEFFLSLFSDIKSIEEYYTKCIDIKDIDTRINKEIKKMIILSEEEEKESTFIEKIEMLKNSKTIKLLPLKTDAEIFHFQMRSYFLQAIDTIFTAVNSGMFPFIRFSPAFSNFQIVAKNFYEIPEVITIVAKSFVNYALLKSMDIVNLEGIDIQTYLKIIADNNVKIDLIDLNPVNDHDINFPEIKIAVNSTIEKLETSIKEYKKKISL